MIYDQGCDPYEDSWQEEAARARQRARARRREQWITNAVGYALVLAGAAWVCLRWLA